MNARERQKLVGRLGGGHAVNLLFDGGNGNVAVDELCVANDLIALDHAGKVALEETLHVRRVRARAAQERGGFKCAPAGAHGEILRVEHDARKQCFGLCTQKIGRVGKILQKLRDELRCAGGVRLVKVERGGFDIIGGTAVMVDDRHAVAGVKQLLGFDKVGAVGVDHHEQRTRLGGDERIASGDEHILIFRQGCKLGENRLGNIILHVDDDLRLFAALARNAADARRRADGVHVGVLVSHDKDLACVGNELTEGVRHHAGFDLCAFFGGFRLAAVELEVEAVAHDDLIAAARERHFD